MQVILYGTGFLYRYDVVRTGPQVLSFALRPSSPRQSQVSLGFHASKEVRWEFHGADLSRYTYR